METRFDQLPASYLAWAAFAGFAAIVILAAFAGWVVFGAEIFLTMAETGLAWCL